MAAPGVSLLAPVWPWGPFCIRKTHFLMKSFLVDQYLKSHYPCSCLAKLVVAVLSTTGKIAPF